MCSLNWKVIAFPMKLVVLFFSHRDVSDLSRLLFGKMLACTHTHTHTHTKHTHKTQKQAHTLWCQPHGRERETFAQACEVLVHEMQNWHLYCWIFNRILFGKMMSKSGPEARGKRRVDTCRSIVFRFLAGCSSTEIHYFLDLAFGPFKHYHTGTGYCYIHILESLSFWCHQCM